MHMRKKQIKWRILGKLDFYVVGWLVGSGEPCFQGWPILYFMNPYAFTLPRQGYVPRPFISISLSPPEGDSIQVLPAVSF